MIISFAPEIGFLIIITCMNNPSLYRLFFVQGKYIDLELRGLLRKSVRCRKDVFWAFGSCIMCTAEEAKRNTRLQARWGMTPIPQLRHSILNKCCSFSCEKTYKSLSKPNPVLEKKRARSESSERQARG